MKRMNLAAIIIAVAIGPVAWAQTQPQVTLPGQNGASLFSNSTVGGSMFNAVTNPLTNAVGGYDQCFKDVLRLETKIYNPLKDPVMDIKKKTEEMKKVFEKQAKDRSKIKEPTATCPRPAKGEKATDYCKKAWKKYDEDLKVYNDKQEADDKKAVAEAEAELKAISSFDSSILGVPNSSKALDQGKTDALFLKLRTMAKNNGFSMGVDSFPASPACDKLNDKEWMARLTELMEFENLAIAFEKQRLDTLRRVAACLDKNASAVSQQVQNLVSQFQAQYQAHAQNLTTMYAHEVERRRIIDTVILPTIIVNGKADGTGKMHEIRDQINAVLVNENGIWAKAANIQTELMKLDQDRANAEAFYQADVAATAVDCFTTGNKGAASNADLQSGKSYGLTNQFAELAAQTIARTNTVNGATTYLSSERTDKNQSADRMRNDVLNKLNAIFYNVPKPVTGGGTGAVSTASGSMRSEESIIAAIKSSFPGDKYYFYKRNPDGSISGDAIPLSLAIENSLNQCFNYARGTEQNMSEPYIRRKNSLNAIDRERKKQVATINTALSDAYKTFVDAANILQLPKRTPEAYGAVMSECRNDQNPRGMADCFDTFRGAMNGLANGSGDMASLFTIQTRYVAPVAVVPGLAALGMSGKASQPVPPVIQISCSGLNDCTRRIDRIRTSLETDITDIKNDRKKYANAAVQQMQTLGQQMMNQGNPALGQPSLQQATNDLMAKINAVQNELANYGVSASGEIPLIPPANWTPISGDDNPLAGFIERPSDPVSAVAAGTIDYRKNPFASLQKGVGEAMKSLGEKTKKITEYQSKIDEKAKACSKEAGDALDTLSKRVTDASGCLLLTGAKLEKDYSTVSDDVFDKLKDIASYFAGSSSSPLKGKGLTECDNLISAGIDPVKPTTTPGQNDLISDSDINNDFDCKAPDPKKPDVIPASQATWKGVKLDESKIRILKTGNFDSSDTNQCEQLKAFTIKTLAACREKLKVTNMSNCQSTSKDLQKKVDEAITKYKKPDAAAGTKAQ